jgi:TolB protein
MQKKEKPSFKKHLLRYFRLSAIALIGVMLILVAMLTWQSLKRRFSTDVINEPAIAAALTLSATTTDTATPDLISSNTPSPGPTEELPADLSQVKMTGSAFLSIYEAGHAHLFAFLLNEMSFLRLTMGDWEDITPAVSPDGTKLAFASNRSGHWDLYVMSLMDGRINQLTDTPEYKANPSWSPDGQWLAYESYQTDIDQGNLEIVLRPVDGSQNAIRLTDDPAADFSPTWSPAGRKIAFVSSRSGDLEIWLADLDKTLDRFQNISRDARSDEDHPTWSPDGNKLAWASTSADGINMLRIWDLARPDDEAQELECGDWPVWDPTGERLLTVYSSPNAYYLTGYRLRDRRPLFPLVAVAGDIEGLSWGNGRLSPQFIDTFTDAVQLTMPPLWLSRSLTGETNNLRSSIVILEGVQAPLAMLQDQADDAFLALRQRVAVDVGWDFLSVLEEAYVPLTSPLNPGYLDDWLYTGRAFKFNSAPLNAGWLLMVKENYGADTYWRIYLRARYQDGTQGLPLRKIPYDITARLSGDPRAYEEGGKRSNSIPYGYWLDFTRLASNFGWERLPSLSSWRIAYSGVRYNEYVLRQGLDWLGAMTEIYPRDALNTTTPVSSPTMTPTPTNTPTLTPTMTRTPYIPPTPTSTLTRRPLATATPRPTKDKE